MPVDNARTSRRLFPTAHRLLLDRLTRARAADVSGHVLVIGAGMTDYSPVFPNADRLLNSDVDTFGPHIGCCLDAENIALRDDSFDWVVAFEVLEHVRRADVAIEEFHRVLRPGGSLLLSVPFLFRIHGDPSDFRRYTRYGLEQLLAEFSSLAIEGYGGRLAVVSDLLTTMAKPLAALRVLNFALLPLGSAGSVDAPSGYFLIARK